MLEELRDEAASPYFVATWSIRHLNGVDRGDNWVLGNQVMKRSRGYDAVAFTRIELLVVLGVITVMAALVLPGIARQKQRVRRVQCTHNLKILGLAFRFRAINGGNQSFSQASTNKEGALHRITSVVAFRYFQVMSNELNPKLLVCPADVRMPAQDLGHGFSNTNLSYFVGLDADERYPQMFLYGDRNLTNGLPLQEGILLLVPNRPLRWTHELHNRQGNVALADGSVQGWASSHLSNAVSSVVGFTNRLAMP